MILSFTGHRPDKLGGEYKMDGPISNWISEEIDKVLIEHKPESGIVGMALGVDMLAAVCLIYRKIPIIAAIPFKGQECMWPEESQDLYNKILSHKLVTRRYICDPGYAAYKMQTRNEWMVDYSTDLLAVWDESSGGTANCIRYAIKKNKNIIHIDPIDYIDKTML